MTLRSFLLSILLVFAGRSALAVPEPVWVFVPFEKVYAPTGFGEGELVQFMAEGRFPSTCYRTGFVPYEARVRGSLIELIPRTYRFPGICLDVMVPFQQLIEMRPLPPGRYQIVQPGMRSILGVIDVGRGRRAGGPYAPVVEIEFRRLGPGRGEAVLSGFFGTGCLKPGEVAVDVQRNAIVLSPLVKKDPGASCVPGRFPFRVTVSLAGVPERRYLLQVRTDGGRAVNTMADFRPPLSY